MRRRMTAPMRPDQGRLLTPGRRAQLSARVRQARLDDALARGADPAASPALAARAQALAAAGARRELAAGIEARLRRGSQRHTAVTLPPGDAPEQRTRVRGDRRHPARGPTPLRARSRDGGAAALRRHRPVLRPWRRRLSGRRAGRRARRSRRLSRAGPRPPPRSGRSTELPSMGRSAVSRRPRRGRARMFASRPRPSLLGADELPPNAILRSPRRAT
jgi:hypothetical protein